MQLRWLEVIHKRYRTYKDGSGRVVNTMYTDTDPPVLQYLNDKFQWVDVPTYYQSKEHPA